MLYRDRNAFGAKIFILKAKFPDRDGKNRVSAAKVRFPSPITTGSDVILPLYTKSYAHCPQVFPQDTGL